MSASGWAAERHILVHGHRGARSVLPENTIPAFEHAIEAGADFIEVDIYATKDDVLIVTHDPTVSPTICSGPYLKRPIRELTLAQVRELDCGSLKNPGFPEQKPVPGARIPTLDEVLQLAPRGKFGFNIEIKMSKTHPEYYTSPEEISRMTLEAIRKHKLDKRVIVQSFDFRPLHAMRRLAPEIRMAALFQNDKRDFTEIAKEAGGTPIVAPNYNLVTKEQVDKAHKAGLQVVPWTANTPDVWQRLVDAGVDAIITDDPAALISFLKKAQLR
jgi:glycerophosphoryl diester phosphodiesterase